MNRKKVKLEEIVILVAIIPLFFGGIFKVVSDRVDREARRDAVPIEKFIEAFHSMPDDPYSTTKEDLVKEIGGHQKVTALLLASLIDNTSQTSVMQTVVGEVEVRPDCSKELLVALFHRVKDEKTQYDLALALVRRHDFSYAEAVALVKETSSGEVQSTLLAKKDIQ